MLKHYYFDISLLRHRDTPVTAAFFKQHIVNCVTSIFGSAGGAIDIDVLKFDPSRGRAYIRVPYDFHHKLWAALTVCEFNTPAAVSNRFTVHKGSALLLALQADSRDYTHQA